MKFFISEENMRLAKSGQILCANINNVYEFMVVNVKRSLSLKRDIVSAQASFRITKIGEECNYDHLPSKKIDWMYMGPILASLILSVINLICFCVNNRQLIVKIVPLIH